MMYDVAHILIVSDVIKSFSYLHQQAEQFLLDHVPIAGRVAPDQMRRDDFPMYPTRATREGLANALSHGDYSIPGGMISLAMYDDRLEIVNSGALHFGITPSLLLKPHDSRPWNPLIADVFYRTGIIEKWGTGTLNIIDLCLENGNPEPDWKEQAGSVVLTFFQREIVTEQKDSQRLQSATQSATQSSDPVERLLIILKQGEQSSGELRELMQIKHRPTFRKNYLHPAMQSGLIEYTIPLKPGSRLQKYRLTAKGRTLLTEIEGKSGE